MLPAQVVVRYKGTHKGKVFDETKGKATFSFRLGALPKNKIFSCAAYFVVVSGQAVHAGFLRLWVAGCACGCWRCLACSATLLNARAVPLCSEAGSLAGSQQLSMSPIVCQPRYQQTLIGLPFVLRRGRRGDQVSSLPATACSVSAPLWSM